MSGAQVSRTSIQLYRDCMRLAKHIGGTVRPHYSSLVMLLSKKGSAIKDLIRREFEKARDETDPEKIEALKTNAIRGLSNYLVLANSSKDKQLQSAMKAQQSAEASSGPAQAEYRDL